MARDKDRAAVTLARRIGVPIITATPFVLLGACASSASTPTPSPEPSVTVTVAPSANAAATPAEKVATTPAVATIDNPYYDADLGGYFFQSPSTNLACAIMGTSRATRVGCRAWSTVENLPQCDHPTTDRVPSVSFVPGQPAQTVCLGEGEYTALARTLEYGASLSVLGVTCTSERTGVTCIDDATGLGFTAARRGFTPIR